MKLATPASHGRVPRSPCAVAHASSRRKRKGSSSEFGCHGSKRSSLPIVHARPAAITIAAVVAMGPPRRWATTAIPITERMLRIATPMASPAPPPILVGRASTSKNSGPGLLMSRPTLVDAEVHVPTRGWWWVKTSRARTAKKALSPIGIHPPWTARAVATTIGSAASTTLTMLSHRSRRGDRSSPATVTATSRPEPGRPPSAPRARRGGPLVRASGGGAGGRSTRRRGCRRGARRRRRSLRRPARRRP